MAGLLSGFSKPRDSMHTIVTGAGVAQRGQRNRSPVFCVCEKFIQLIPQSLILAETLAFDLISIYNIFGKM